MTLIKQEKLHIVYVMCDRCILVHYLPWLLSIHFLLVYIEHCPFKYRERDLVPLYKQTDHPEGICSHHHSALGMGTVLQQYTYHPALTWVSSLSQFISIIIQFLNKFMITPSVKQVQWVIARVNVLTLFYIGIK